MKKTNNNLYLLGIFISLSGEVAWGSVLEDVKLSSRFQVGAISNDNGSENVFPSGFLNFDEGINVNRAELIVEKDFKTNIKPRIGPFPGAKPEQADWGFEIDLRYGKDAAITYGLDDELDINDANERLYLLPQWFFSGYLPVADGFSWMVGSWFTPVGYEIGAPVDPPTAFYTHSYAFAYQPVKHVGLLSSIKLPVDNSLGIVSVDLGIVQGWNNLQDNNHDKTIIFNLRWRSEDFRTWLDLENIIGYEQSEDGVSDQTRPFNAVSLDDDKLMRRTHTMTLTHRYNQSQRMVMNLLYGFQEGGDLVADANNPPGFLITEDSRWYGANMNYYVQLDDNKQLGLRAEWFRDEKGAHALLPEGIYKAVTVNLSWWPLKHLRVRPELRYDQYSGPGKPYGGRLPTVFFGEEQEQWVASLDATWFYSL
ncbi:MAG: porin [Candidatus Thiodiazotropha sp. (ex Codakia rugifera)]|nr:porin [Candidatus Thiodiazotropha sp. (ex Codakia rugifera)]